MRAIDLGPTDTEYLTGMRGVAALLVFLIHSGGLGLRGLGPLTDNFVDAAKFGVAIFFVISAYCLCLITGPEWQGKRVDWTEFYTRRIFRIIPMYFVALFSAAALLALTGKARADLGWSLLSHITFFNIFDVPHAHDIFVEWTVVIEFAFYAIFPIVLLLARKLRWSLILVALFLSWKAARMTLITWIGGAYASDFYYTLPFHLYAFLFGVVAYVAVRKGPWPRIPSEIVAWASLVYLIWSMTALDDNANEVPITWAAAGLIVGCANPRVSLAIILRAAPLTYLGTISFSIYLLHTLILQFAPSGLFGAWSALALTIAISALTYEYIEQPLRQYGRSLARSRHTRRSRIGATTQGLPTDVAKTSNPVAAQSATNS